MRSLVLLLIADLLVVAGAAGVTTLLRPARTSDALVELGVLCAASVAGIELAAAAAGALEPGVLLALAAAWALAGAFAWRRGDALPRPPRLALREHPWASALVMLATVALLWRLVVSVVLPPYAYDALTYHLTIVFDWVRSGGLGVSDLSLCCARYPSNAELMFAWNAVLTGSQTFVDTVEVGFALLGAVAVAALARTAAVPRAGAMAAGALFACTPVLLAQGSTAYADVMIASVGLAGLHLVTRFAATGQARLLIPAGLAAGLLLGTKGTGIVWAAVLTVAVLVLVVRGRRRTVGAAGAFLAGLLALGAWWYVRNWIDTGNPVFPFRVSAAGTTIFRGPLRVSDVLTVPPGGPEPWPVSVVRAWVADLHFWTQRPYQYEQRVGGLGPLWSWLGLPLLAPIVVVLVRRRSLALLWLGLIALVFLLAPYRWWSRFTIDLMAAGGVAIAASAAWAPRRWMRWVVQVAALLLAAAGVGLTSYAIDPAAHAHPVSARRVLQLAKGRAADRTLGRVFFPEYRFLDRMPAAAAIVVDLRAPASRFTAPLFGAGLSRRVLPAGPGPPPRGAWLVTGAGRPLDRLARARGYQLVSDVRGLHAWRPAR
ncbi:MAG: hypothetical protein QOK21_2818 [Solirubrobacteraceae bacterium]|nr:hypothetical protein [Solirubrobacteraceae bacterium]